MRFAEVATLSHLDSVLVCDDELTDDDALCNADPNPHMIGMEDEVIQAEWVMSLIEGVEKNAFTCISGCVSRTLAGSSPASVLLAAAEDFGGMEFTGSSLRSTGGSSAAGSGNFAVARPGGRCRGRTSTPSRLPLQSRLRCSLPW